MQKLDLTCATESVFSQLQQLKTNLFSGSLSIDTGNNLSWTVYCRLGRIVWATGGAFPVERWRRHLTLFCPDVTDAQLEQISAIEDSHQEYRILTQLLQTGDSARRQQLVDLVSSSITEVLFDVVQYSVLNGGGCFYKINANDTLGSLFTLIPTEQACISATQAWEKWATAGLTSYSPNLFLVIQQPDILRERAFGNIYQLIRNLVDGKRTLRSLAAKSHQDSISLTKSLLPLIEAGALSFSQVPVFRKFDLPLTNEKESVNLPSLNTKGIASYPPKKTPSQIARSSRLIVCVDDSPLVCQALEKILIPQGYRFLGIEDSVKAIPLLLKNQPDFIFLDLIMPVTNGYELCSQLRKTPSLKEVPIVILTGKDGLVDRMRSKLVGASGFMSKPVKKEQVLEMMLKYSIV